MKDNRIKKLVPLAESKFLSLYDAEYENRKGTEKHWIIASRKHYETLKAQYNGEIEERIDAVIIAAFHKETKSLVIIKQFRIPLNDYVYELPAGLLDADESMETAVRRELKEETGLSLASINYERSSRKVYISAGMTDESVAMVYCTCEGTLSSQYLEADEDIEAFLISQEEAKDFLKKDIKMDIKIHMILESFALLGEELFN
jgi:ADP-ribose pyrophosphatase